MRKGLMSNGPFLGGVMAEAEGGVTGGSEWRSGRLRQADWGGDW